MELFRDVPLDALREVPVPITDMNGCLNHNIDR